MFQALTRMPSSPFPEAVTDEIRTPAPPNTWIPLSLFPRPART